MISPEGRLSCESVFSCPAIHSKLPECAHARNKTESAETLSFRAPFYRYLPSILTSIRDEGTPDSNYGLIGYYDNFCFLIT